MGIIISKDFLVEDVSAVNIYIGADHRGYDLKQFVLSHFQAHRELNFCDVGSYTPGRCDHPVYAFLVARHVHFNSQSRGILICGSGQGMVMTANKIPGAYASLCWEDDGQSLTARAHNGCNVLCIPAERIEYPSAVAIIDTWLRETEPSTGVYRVRQNQISVIEGFAQELSS